MNSEILFFIEGLNFIFNLKQFIQMHDFKEFALIIRILIIEKIKQNIN